MQLHSERAQMVDGAMIAMFVEMLFGTVSGGAVMLRGIGEAGTPQEGKFREQVPFSLGALVETADIVTRHAQRWAQHEVATFIVPAVLDASCLEDRKGTEDKVRLYTALVVDLDTGDTDAKRGLLESALGYATMSVRSGGTTETGHPKRHLWWALSEPTTEVARVAALRERLALYAGGDPSFKRATQIIRVPGTVHGKGGVAKLCAIE